MSHHGEEIRVGQNEDLRTQEFGLRGGVEIMGGLALTAEQRIDPTEGLLIQQGRLTAMDWPGGVSAKKFIEQGLTSEKVLDEAVKNLNKYYVLVNPEAKTRCIDGRHDPELDENHLGPQVPGGAPGAALAYRLGVNENDLLSGTFLTDAERMISDYIRHSLAPGGHRDKQSKGEDVGCGAIDRMDLVVATMTHPDLVNDHKRLTKLLMGPYFNRSAYLQVMGAAVEINGRSEDYFRDRDSVISILEKRAPKSVATLEGTHQECIMAVNMVPNTTFSSNHFSRDYEGMQAFGYDLWRSIEIAKKLLPGPHNDRAREMFVTARVMTSVATLMVLTDGSQRLVVREPSATESSPN